MSEWVDLSLTLGGPRMSVVPGHPEVTFEPINTHKEHFRSNTYMKMSIHCGTHVDCPRHFVDGGTTIDEMPIERYMGPGVLADLRGKVGENESKQLHRATQGNFTWHSDEPPRLGGDDNHPQPLTYLTAGIGQ